MKPEDKSLEEKTIFKNGQQLILGKDEITMQ